MDALSSRSVYTFALVVGGAAVLVLRPKKTAPNPSQANDGGDSSSLQRVATHNAQRLAALASGGPADHHSFVVVVYDDGFSLNNTIFASVDSALNRMILQAKLGSQAYWSDAAQVAVRASFQRKFGPPPVLPDPNTAEIFDFMETECDFKCEHADGSFLDHLHFCRDYSAAHFPGHSPTVLLLHSICGVATNLFPMAPEKLPQLARLLTPDELRHITAFPSVLRLLYDLRLLDRLKGLSPQALGSLKSITFHRVMDNEPMSLSADELWVHLNYQVVHLIDFLPAAFWAHSLGDPLFGTFIDLHSFLTATGKLEARVDFAMPNPGEATYDGVPMTLGRLVSKYAPQKVQRLLAAKSIRKWSAAKGHDLSFELEFS